MIRGLLFLSLLVSGFASHASTRHLYVKCDPDPLRVNGDVRKIYVSLSKDQYSRYLLFVGDGKNAYHDNFEFEPGNDPEQAPDSNQRVFHTLRTPGYRVIARGILFPRPATPLQRVTLDLIPIGTPEVTVRARFSCTAEAINED